MLALIIPIFKSERSHLTNIPIDILMYGMKCLYTSTKYYNPWPLTPSADDNLLVFFFILPKYMGLDFFSKRFTLITVKK